MRTSVFTALRNTTITLAQLDMNLNAAKILSS